MAKYKKMQLAFFLISCLISLSFRAQSVIRDGTSCYRAIDIKSIENCDPHDYVGKGSYWFYFVADSPNVTIIVNQPSHLDGSYSPIAYIIGYKGGCDNQGAAG